MLEELYSIHNLVIQNIPTKIKRYLYHQINWEAQAICVFGARGTGKTTMLLQYCLEKYRSAEECLYISADNITVVANGLFKIAQECFKYGGKALIIDEIHKYPNWSQELKNILDVYKDKKILVSGSSTLDLKMSKFDLSRRVVFYQLKGLSFREFLNFETGLNVDVCELSDILTNHTKISTRLNNEISTLKFFKQYLTYGYYPFYLENKADFLTKLFNVVEKVLFEDIATVFNLSMPKLPHLKKMLHLFASAPPFVPNIDKMSRELALSKETVYHYLEYLSQAGLLTLVPSLASGYKAVRKPGKVYLDNTNLIYAITGEINISKDTGNIRETFFANQTLNSGISNKIPKTGDFFLEDAYLFEVGGPNKSFDQIKDIPDSFLAIEGIESGFRNKIPLYLFGLLY